MRATGRGARLVRFALAAAAAAALSGGLAASAQAVSFQVNQTGDAADAAINGSCDVDTGTAGLRCTLRAAIQESNASSAVADTITFMLPSPTITLASALPTVDDPVTIDGTTQPGWSANALAAPAALNTTLTVVLDANGKKSLVITGGDTTVKGLVIQHALDNGITLQAGGNNTIQGNFIGTSQDGVADQGNGLAGILIDASSGNTIGGPAAADRNLISGNGDPLTGGLAYGVWVKEGDSTQITGNLIGVDKSGTADLGNVLSGVRLGGQGTGDASNSIVRGNVLSGNGGSQEGWGVQVTATGTGIKILGNRIGTDVTGTMPIGNSPDGIELINDNSRVEVGGSAAGEGNLISGNISQGIYLNSRNHLIQGNRIGTDATGTAALANGQNGIYLNGQTANTIGGTGPQMGNLISGNGQSGVRLEQGASGNFVQGNFIGTNAAGTGAVPNQQDGVQVDGGDGNLIGGGQYDPVDGGGGNVISGNLGRGVALVAGETILPDSNTVTANLIGVDKNRGGAIGNGGAGILVTGGNGNKIGQLPHAVNIVAHNGGAGVVIQTGTSNEIRANSIFSNAGLGIDLVPTGVTPNDSGDGDTGPNQLQNFPVLTSLVNGTVTGTLSSEPNKTYKIEFFRVAACDASGYGEGQTALGTQDVTTDANGSASFTQAVPNPTADDVITATATDPAFNTSEFSACRAVDSAPTENPPTTTNPPPTNNPPPTCTDRRAPITTLRRPGLVGTGGNVHISSRTTLQLSGTSRDRPSCPSGVRKVDVSLARVHGLHGVNCRFITQQDRYALTPRKNCRRPTLFTATGTTNWTFTFDVPLAPGKYRVVARATDKAGNKEKPTKGRNILAFTVG
jgi:hypothetical protein